MERRAYARWAGVALLVAVLSVIVLHLGPGIIGGQRATGTSDVASITAFYSHPSMRVFWWQGGVSILAIIAFGVLFRRYLLTFDPSPAVVATADAGLAIAIAAAPLYAISSALQSAMAQLVSAGAEGDYLLGVFASWDWIYNSLTYWFEAGFMAAWAIAAWKTRSLPRWVAVVGGLTAVGHLFNSQVLVSHMSDTLTLIPTVLFFVWFVSAGVYLVRGGRATGPV